VIPNKTSGDSKKEKSCCQIIIKKVKNYFRPPLKEFTVKQRRQLFSEMVRNYFRQTLKAEQFDKAMGRDKWIKEEPKVERDRSGADYCPTKSETVQEKLNIDLFETNKIKK